MRKPLIFAIFSLFLLMVVSGAAIASDGPAKGPTKLTNSVLSGAEDMELSSDVGGPVSTSPATQERRTEIQIGDTRYDYQHNGSMGRQVVFSFDGDDVYAGVHFDWMCLPCGAGARHIQFNSVNFAGNWAYATGPNGGKAFPEENGGYCNIDISNRGVDIPAYHHGADPDVYSSCVFWDLGTPNGPWVSGENPGPTESVPPPNCEQISTGSYELDSRYIWPKNEFDICGTTQIIHKVATESPPTGAPAGEIQTVVYYRDIVNPGPPLTITPPACGKYIDAVYDITAVVRQDPNSDEVAVVWGHPIYLDTDPNDPCGFTQWQNDVYVWKSTDCGVTWDEGNKQNITDYTQGGTVEIDQVTQLFYTDLSAVYDHDGILHVVWSTPLRDPTEDGCQPLFISRIWHWDDFNNCISLVYDATTPALFTDPGAWNNSTCKVNISECYVGSEKRMYCSFTRFGAHFSDVDNSSEDQSDAGYENGEIFLTGSTNGGLTWGPDPNAPAYGGCVADGPPCQEKTGAAGTAINLTNTCSPGCLANACFSEHWSSMAKYSYDSVHIEYILDKDAGGYPQTEGTLTCNPVMYMKYECFEPAEVCQLSHTPTEVGYPTFIAPNGEPDCTGPYTTTFDLTIVNVGNIATNYTVTSNATWLTYFGGDPMSGPIPAGCNNIKTITMQLGPIGLPEGVYCTTMDITGCGGAYSEVMDVCVYVYCQFFIPEYEILSTACWSVGVWNNARSGTAQHDDPEGNMYWFLPYEFPVMYDESVIITYADDTCQTWFSIFDGSDDNVDLVALSYLTTQSFPNYDYGHGLWGNGDTNIVGEIEYFLPTHPDTCVLIERIKVCNNTDADITIHIGEGIDWDIPDADGGNNNDCAKDDTRQEVYQFGTPPATPEADYYGGAGFVCPIPGAIVLDNSTWVYPNGGYEPCEIGGLLARQNTFDAVCDSAQDYNSVYVIAQNVTLAPDSCRIYCKVKTSSIEASRSLSDLQDLIDKGKAWIIANGLDCPCYDQECNALPGDPNASGGFDIDDVVYLIAYIFSGGPAPTPYDPANGDPNCSCGIDIDDVVYMIAYIFSGGPEPCSCEDWVAACGELK